jgi:dihydrofolate reductase
MSRTEYTFAYQKRLFDNVRQEVRMRRVRYAVAASLDGYIAGPNGEADWIVMDPDIDFKALFNQFDTVLLGRRTFQAMASAGKFRMPGMKTFVFFPHATLAGSSKGDDCG